jgi:hypothetical protein
MSSHPILAGIESACPMDAGKPEVLENVTFCPVLGPPYRYQGCYDDSAGPYFHYGKSPAVIA